MNAIILCGGLSTRLGEITKGIPKILLEIGNRTVLDWQLEKLKSVGISEVVLAAGHLSEVLQKEIGEERNELKIIYAVEDKRLGTGGAIKNAMKDVANPNEPMIVLNGDVLTTIDLADMLSYLRDNSDGIILAVRVDDASVYGTLDYDSNYHLRQFKEKMGVAKAGYINGGFYLFNPTIKQYFPEKEEFSIEYDVFPNVSNLYVYESDRPWVDIGVPERLEWARENWQTFLN